MDATYADQLNEHLSTPGNVVTVTTCTRSTAYRHAGSFRTSATGNLQVRSGKQWLTLSHGDTLLVAVRMHSPKVGVK